MIGDVHFEQAEPRQLAAISSTIDRPQLSAAIGDGLGKIWPVLRTQSAQPGHSIVVYRAVQGDRMTIDVGVEVFGGFTADGDIGPAATPGGDVATIAYFGPYSEMAPAYAALEAWWTANGRRPGGASWEIYGDWDEDPAKMRTDICVLLAPA